jgi:hypothetical protein
MRWSKKLTSWFACRSLLDLTSVRLPNSVSASSKRRIAWPASAASKRAARFFSVSPIHFDVILLAST